MMGLLNRLYNFVAGTRANPDEVDAEFDNIISGHNALDNALTTHMEKAADSTSTDSTKDKHLSNKDLNDIYVSLNNKYNTTDVYSKAELQSITSGNSGAKKIGATPISTSPSDVQGILQWLKNQMDSLVLGQISDGSITISKLSFDPATQVELDAVKSSVSDGKTLVKNAITGKGGTVLDADGDGFPTHQELANGVNTIQTSVAINGTAADGDVLASKTYYNTDAKVQRTGTMANRGAMTITPGTTDQIIPAGYHNGSGIVSGDADLISSNIKAGINILGVAGKTEVVDTTTGAGATAAQILAGKEGFVNGPKVVGTMPNKIGSATILTPSTVDQAIPQGYFGGVVGDGKVAGDANLVAANILNTATIFGVTGSAIAGKRMASGNKTTDSSGDIAITGLAFKPSTIIAYIVSNPFNNHVTYQAGMSTTQYFSGSIRSLDGTNQYVNTGSFKLSTGNGSTNYNWIAYE